MSAHWASGVRSARCCASVSPLWGETKSHQHKAFQKLPYLSFSDWSNFLYVDQHYLLKKKWLIKFYGSIAMQCVAPQLPLYATDIPSAHLRLCKQCPEIQSHQDLVYWRSRVVCGAWAGAKGFIAFAMADGSILLSFTRLPRILFPDSSSLSSSASGNGKSHRPLQGFSVLLRQHCSSFPPAFRKKINVA